MRFMMAAGELCSLIRINSRQIVPVFGKIADLIAIKVPVIGTDHRQGRSQTHEVVMPLKPSDCPPASEIDIPAMRAKYLRERDRRIKKNHNDQYVSASGKWADIYEVDPYTPVKPRAPITGETEVVILGAGYCGMMVVKRRSKGTPDRRRRGTPFSDNMMLVC